MWRRTIIRCYGLLEPIKSGKVSISCTQIRKVQMLLNYEQKANVKSGHKQERIQNKTEESILSQVNSFTYRSHNCGELRPEQVEQKVTLCGWVQYVRMSKFLLVRDSYGLIQCINNYSTDINFDNIPLETVVKIKGTVVRRPKNMVNMDMATGEIEVLIDELEILNKVDKIPFNLRNYQKPKEQLRMQYRYIDLRFPEMQSNLRRRSLMLHNMRKFLVEKHNFVEVETPTLFCRTPGGAREFIVPTHYSGLFYSLVQSPQQFKQMLMAGGIDRYFQIARCYRDECTRPDRQPEFTQLDIELSFAKINNIISMVECLLQETFLENLPKSPFLKMTYKDALENYGSDKPNLTYELKLKKLTHLFANNKPDFGAFSIPYPSKLGKFTAQYKEKVNDLRKKYNVKVVLNENILNEFGQDVKCQIENINGDGNHAIITLGDNESASLCLGDIRELLAPLLRSKELIVIKDTMEPLWVVDFPLFVKGERGLQTCHHPFTAPHPDDMHLLDTEPLKVRSLAYDIVLNGNEIGGGSVRIHKAELQERILTMLDIDGSKMSHFLNALRSGCPPHAGIALGIDRMMAIACKAESIRDVMAFPKTHEGKDPLSGAPNEVSDEDKKYYFIKSIEA